MADLSVINGKQAQGERIIVRGRVVDENDRPVPHTMIEIWQANAGGRYDHPGDQHDAPLDPNFHGGGRVFSDAEGWYQFTSRSSRAPIRGATTTTPGGRTTSITRCSAPASRQRIITQMYFPGDPLLALDPVYLSVPDQAARERLIAQFDIDITSPEWALGYRFDFVLRGRDATPTEQA